MLPLYGHILCQHMSIHVNTMVGGSDKCIQYGPRKMQKDAIYQYHYVFESEIEPAITFCICLGLPLSIFWDSITHMHIIVHSLEPKWPLFLSANPSIFLGSIWVNTFFYILYIHYIIISSYISIYLHSYIQLPMFPQVLAFPRAPRGTWPSPWRHGWRKRHGAMRPRSSLERRRFSGWPFWGSIQWGISHDLTSRNIVYTCFYMFIHVYTCLYMLIPLMVITCDNWGMVYCCFTYVRKKTWKKHVRYIISPNGDSS